MARYQFREQLAVSWESRLNIIVWLTLAGLCLITYRLFQKSVVEHPIYAAKAESQYEVSRELPSKRGAIYAQDFQLGTTVPIAATEELFDISVVPRNIKDKKEAAAILAKVFELDEQDIFSQIDNEKLYLPPLVRGVNKKKRDEIVEQGFAGLLIERHNQRVYPENSTAAHLLGFVNREGVGNYGLEGYYDEDLIGKAGSVVGEKDTLGRIISTVSEVRPEDGNDLELSIDHNVQYALEEILTKAVEEYEAESGLFILMNPKTGALIAASGSRSFDPNHYSDIPVEETDRYLNPAISNVYEPGSIFKPLIMSAAIDYGKVEPGTEETFGKDVYVQGYRISTAEDKAFGTETMTQVLENSDNVGMVWVAGKMSNEELYNKLVAYGFDSKSGIELSGETLGYLLGLDNWHDINRATMSFGQGISATPLQLMRAWSAMINGGKLVRPYVVQRIIGQRGVAVEVEPEINEGVISEETSAKIREMLESVVVKGHGKLAAVKGYRIGGKTGTAQIASPNGGYLEGEFIHSFMGFFPANDPEYLLLVKLDKPKTKEFSASTASPTFAKMATYILNYFQVPQAGETE
ncbi:penicillin-binding protein 2 [Candidatus Berkelbacteria bacterium]|nr:penicillin-binding protein 2 [Candidatus Berkelbacteria bacterium]